MAPIGMKGLEVAQPPPAPCFGRSTYYCSLIHSQFLARFCTISPSVTVVVTDHIGG